MAKRTGPANKYLKKLIENLKKKSLEFDAPIWKDVAEKLEKPRRKRVEVNIVDIERHTNSGDVVVIPGVVLGSGELTKPVTIAAWKFSAAAKKKIEKSKSKDITIDELLEINPKGSGVKILT